MGSNNHFITATTDTKTTLAGNEEDLGLTTSSTNSWIMPQATVAEAIPPLALTGAVATAAELIIDRLLDRLQGMGLTRPPEPLTKPEPDQRRESRNQPVWDHWQSDGNNGPTGISQPTHGTIRPGKDFLGAKCHVSDDYRLLIFL